MLDDDPLEECRRYRGVPHAFRIHDDDRPTGAYAEARRLATLHSLGTEEKALALQKRRQQLIQLAPPVIRRAVAADAHQHVA